MTIMAENSERKKCQQNLLNYVSHNLNTKVEKEKERKIAKKRVKQKVMEKVVLTQLVQIVDQSNKDNKDLNKVHKD